MLEEKTKHFYCHKCGSHYFKNRFYTEAEWFFYVNEQTFAMFQKELKIYEQAEYDKHLVKCSTDDKLIQDHENKIK